MESQSKRILERRGVDTKDGVEGVWEGVKVGAEEVRGLEGLVGVLGRGRGRGRGRDVRMEEEEKAGAVEGDGNGEEMDTS